MVDLTDATMQVSISANELAAGNGAPTVYELPIMFKVPTAGGTNTYETIIELKRPAGTTTKWKR